MVKEILKDKIMPDKEIIIDGIDVSKCRYYNSNIKMDCLLFPLQPDKCKGNINCYFKQLQCRTTECKNKSFAIGNLGYKIHNQRKEINERLRQLEALSKKCKKYKQALDEIEKELKEDIYCENQECGCDDFEECLKCTKKYILDIITKAKDGNNAN